MNTVNVMRERISQAHYEVKPDVVASAILERLLAGSLVPNEFKR
jgi:hypothetical protein